MNGIQGHSKTRYLDPLPRYSDEMRMNESYSPGVCRGPGKSSPTTSARLERGDHQRCNVHMVQSSVQPLRVCVVSVISCVAVCAALVLATVAITLWDSDKETLVTERHQNSYRRPIMEPGRTRMQPYEKYGNGRTYLHQFGLRPYSRHDMEEDSTFRDTEDQKMPNIYQDRIYKHNSEKENNQESKEDTDIDTAESKIVELAKVEAHRQRLSFNAKVKVFNSTKTEPQEKTAKNLDLKQQYQPEYDTTLEHMDKRIEKKDQPKIPLDPVHIPEFKSALPDVFQAKESSMNILKLPDGYIAGLRKYDEDYYDSNDYAYSQGVEYSYYYDSEGHTLTSYLIQKVQELYDWITHDPDLEGPGKHQNSKNSEFSDILRALNDSIVMGNASIVFAKIREVYDAENGTAELDLSRTRQALTNSSSLVSLGLLALDVMLLHSVQLLAWDEQKSAKEEMMNDPEVFAFNAIFMDPNKVKPLYEDFKQNRLISEQKRRNGEYIEYTTETTVAATTPGQSSPPNRSVLEDVLNLGLSTARAALYLSRAYKSTRAAFNHAKFIHNHKNTLPIMARSPQRRTMVRQMHGRHIKIDGKMDLEEEETKEKELSTDSPNANKPTFNELDCVWNLYCKNLDRTSKLSGPYGMLAKINGLGLRLIVGEFPMEKALDTLIVEALTGWRHLDCDRMFSKCSGENASRIILESIMGGNKTLLTQQARNI